MSKRCFKCGEGKSLSEFYAHPMMADGRLGKCKECTKRDVREYYANSRKDRSAYEYLRNQTLDRRAKKMEYQRRHRERYPERYQARQAVANALRNGTLQRRPCRECGKRAQAHHADYTKPLEIDWLCFKCHREGEHGQVVVVA